MMNFLLVYLITFLFSQDGGDSIKYKMFLAAVENESTAPNYVLVVVTNLNNNETKEICTEAPFLEGALHIESKLGYDEQSNKKVKDMLIKQKDLRFSFKKEQALENIGFNKYDESKLSLIRNKYNLDALIDIVLKKGSYEFTFEGDTQEQVYLSHLLLRKCIMVSRGSVTGNYLSLEIFNDKRHLSDSPSYHH